ncbi:DeoR/GlpR family DNA-binding transcription regulator [uncultured Aeromicrobium sp.]|uniref:DeoR/GlpR family DNA-binding transcription regulator n=1 Tax=uncultured Aeromicrobium sp. TaxID=337820 RepID=UPI0025DA04AF|nr:DeoR/GlpR family DNA-binding transcription regulator [uncultured Aeromicrobium sp.]
MNRFDRLSAILELLSAHQQLGIDEFADQLRVSAATIRRDLDHLAGQGLLTRTRGGAVALGTVDLPIRYKAARHAPEKQRIGAAAAELVRAGSVVGINGGTTTTEVARALGVRPELMVPSVEHTTLVTNAVNIANELTVREHLRLIVTGGRVRSKSYELTGAIAHAVMSQFNLDIAILGVDGVDPEAGATTHDDGEAGFSALMVQQAKRVAVVADGSKVGAVTFARMCPASAIDVLVTDQTADEDVVKRFESLGVEVLRVP